MRRISLILGLLIATGTAALAADQMLVGWDFSQAADVKKWDATHSLAPFVAAEGVLKTRATDGDPYMIAAGAKAFDVEGNDFQYLEIKLKCDKNGGGEFFWANTAEGKDLGFMAGQEIPFSIKGDGAFHLYRIFPGWTGHVSRLRFDPPEGTAIEIASLRLMQAPVTRHDPLSRRWDFGADGAGGFVPTSGCLYDPVADGLKVTLDSTDAVLIGPAVTWKAADSRWLTLHLTTAAPLQLTLKWATNPEGRFGGSDLLSVDVARGEQYLTLDLAELAGWTGSVTRLALSLTGAPGDALTLHSLGVSPQPEGPPRLKVLSFATDRAIMAAGESVKLVLRCRNDGGAPARELRATLTATGSPASLSLPSPTAAPDVAPGATAELTWVVPAVKAGVADLSVQIAGAGLYGQTQAATSLLVTLPAPELPVAKTPLVKVLGSAAVLANENLRLVFLSTGQPGLSVARVELRQGEGYRVMGCLPALARLAVDTDAAPVAVPLEVSGSGATADEAWLKLTGKRAGLGVEVTYRLAARKFWADLSYRLTVQDKKPHTLKAFQGPWLWAGESGFGDAQDRAIFPGVEWLVQGERSSSALDIAPPNHTRFAPHPNWITVPSMAVQQDGAVVGLLWDPMQKWDGTRLRPGAVFASPNFVEGRRNHLLGLFLPSIPDFVQPNTLLAKEAYPLKAGQTLTLQASLLARPRTEVTEAVTAWYERFPQRQTVPDLPPMPRSYAATVDMAMKCFEDVLWDPKGGGWHPVVGWKPGWDLGVAQMYQTAALIRPDQPEAAAWQARAKETAAGSNDLTFALRQTGNAAAALRDLLARGQSEAASQPEGARYVFHPDGPRKALGREGETASGIGASEIEHILELALRTGDSTTVEAGLKGLGFLDQFDVPRAAQVWECPLHSPDILASGQVCRAYLRGYRLTGEQRYLQKAIYWARTGLPFVYAWQAPEMPSLMKYSTIPIFGATFFTGSWFGVPVQWNGLNYAAACLDLAPYDPTFPWRQIGEGITISGMNQQSVRAKDYGCYTDNWNLVTNTECVGCMLSPVGLMSNVFRLMGAPSTAGVDGVRSPTGWIAVNGPAAVTDAALEGGALRVNLSYLPGQSGVAAVLPVSRPTTVSVDGQALQYQDQGRPEDGQWAYDRNLGCVTVKLTFGAKPSRLTVTGVERHQVPLSQTDWVFSEPGDTQGWTAAHDLTEATVADGAMKLQVTGGDPYLIGPGCSAKASELRGIAIKLRVAKPGCQFYWATDSGPIAEARNAPFNVPADGQFHEVTVDLTSHPEWRGLIRQLRLDPGGQPGDTVEVQWIKLAKR